MTTQTTQSVNSQIGQPATADFNLLSLPKASNSLAILLGFPEGASSRIGTAITRPIAPNGTFVSWTAR